MLLADYTLDSNIKFVRQFMKFESRRQDFNLCKEVLLQLEEFLEKHSSELSKDNIDKNSPLRIVAQSLFITFIITYSKTFLSADGGTMLDKKEISKIIKNEFQISYHEDIIRIRNTYVGHGQLGSIYEKIHVSYKVVIVKEKGIRKMIQPSATRTFIPSKVEILHFKELSNIFYNYFHEKADEIIPKISEQLPVAEIALFLSGEKVRLKTNLNVQRFNSKKQLSQSIIDNVYNSLIEPY